MKINYDKSGPISVGLDEDRFNEFVKLFCCKKRWIYYKILRSPSSFTKLKREDLYPVIYKIIKSGKLDG